jgi:MFS transporter, ACS family, D-galactonate transporter
VAKGAAVLQTISANSAAIQGVIAVGPDLQKIAPFAAQLTALSNVPPAAFAYLKAYGAAVQKAAAQSPGRWKTWYWICVGGIIFFLLSIPLLRGRWKPSDARRDEEEHEAMVAAELAKLQTPKRRPVAGGPVLSAGSGRPARTSPAQAVSQTVPRVSPSR